MPCSSGTIYNVYTTLKITVGVSKSDHESVVAESRLSVLWIFP